MRKGIKFRTFAGILAWIIAMGTFPPAVSGAEEIETEPTSEIEEIYEEAEPVEAEFFWDEPVETEPEETESEVIEPEETESEEIEPEETESEVIEPEETESEEIEPEETGSEEIEPEETGSEEIEPEETGSEEIEPEEETQPEVIPEVTLYEQLLLSETLTAMYELLTAEENAETLALLTEEEITELIAKADDLYNTVFAIDPMNAELALSAEIISVLNGLPNAPVAVTEEIPVEIVNVQEKMAEFATAVALFPNEADFILYDEENDAEIFDEEAYYAAYAAFYEENPDIWMTTDALFAEAEAAYAEENPDGDIDAWMQDNGFWEAAEKFYWVVPTPDAVAEKTAQYEEVELEFTAEEEALELFALENGTVKDTASPDVTVKLFNYSKEINKFGISAAGYEFTHSEGDSVNGNNSRGNYDFSSWNNNHKRLPLRSVLKDGYPDTMLWEGEGYSGQEYPVEDSLAYLFDESEIEGKRVYPEMSGGGGLFQKDEDGYYVYDSAENAAYYDLENGKFVLYDKTIIRPSYTNEQGNIVRAGNFLPFNEVTSDTVSNNNNDIRKYGDITGYKLSEPVDLWFGMVIEFEFLMPKDGLVNGEPMIFDFHGDDDVMVYIDDRLVLDISGSHYAESGTIDFENGVATVKGTDRNGVTSEDLTVTKNFTEIFDYDDLEGGTFKDYTVHKLKFFYLERGGSISYCKLRFNMPTLPNNSITVGKELTVADSTGNITIENILKDTLTYKFRVMKTNGTDDLTDDVPLTGVSYKIYDDGTYDPGDSKTYEVRTLGSDGIIELKSGERALIENTLGIFGEKGGSYYVQELIPEDISEQYAGVQVDKDLDKTTVTVDIDGENSVTYKGYNTDTYHSLDNGSTYSVFTNKVDVSKLSAFSVKKEVMEGSTFEKNQEFKFWITFGDEPLADTSFMVSKEGSSDVISRKTDADGILIMQDGETAVLENLISGTEYTVTEIGGDDYNAVYEAANGEGSDDTAVVGENQISGTLALHSNVMVTVTNSSYNFKVDVPISKQFIGNSEGKSAEFEFILQECDKDGVLKETGTSLTKKITVTGEKVGIDKFIIGYISSEVDKEDVFYYRITEAAGQESHISYDDSVYIVGVKINGDNTAEIISFTKDNETVDTAAFINSSATSVTITKTVSGNMGDTSKEFEFTWKSGEEGEESTFTLAHGESKILSDIMIGSELYLKEERGTYTAEVMVGNKEILPTDDGWWYIIEVDTADEIRVEVTNTYNATIDTAVHLDYLPYILILTAVIPTMTLAVSRKRRRRED